MSFYSSNKTTGTTQMSQLELDNDPPVSEIPSDSVSALSFSPTAEILAAASWDGKVRLFEVNAASGAATKRAEYEHQGPVLAVCWYADGSKVVSGGLDNAVRAYDLQTGQSAQIGQHDAPVKCVECVDAGSPIIASASWDKTLRYWDMRQPGAAVSTVQLPERAYAMATEKKLLVVGTADKQICIIDLSNPGQIYRTSPSPLKMQIRTLACHSNGTGFAVGSIEGRCAIHYIDPKDQTDKGFSFKCHRQSVTIPRPVDSIYALNSIKFHPGYGTFVTSGSDGTIMIWDKESKLRLRHSKALGNGVTATAFNAKGTLFAYAVGYEWSKGYQFNTGNLPNTVKVHVMNEAEVRPRNKK